MIFYVVAAIVVIVALVSLIAFDQKKQRDTAILHAWREGVEACKRGWTVNPYLPDIAEYKAWSEGWQHADRERVKRTQTPPDHPDVARMARAQAVLMIAESPDKHRNERVCANESCCRIVTFPRLYCPEHARPPETT